MCPLFLPAELSVLIWWDIYFLMNIWELGRKFSEDEVLQFPCGLAWKDTKAAFSLKGSPGKGSHTLKLPCALILVTLRSTLQQEEQFCPYALVLFLQGHHFTNKVFEN